MYILGSIFAPERRLCVAYLGTVGARRGRTVLSFCKRDSISYSEYYICANSCASSRHAWRRPSAQ